MKAYAITEAGYLRVDTVMPTRRGAIVNWLVLYARQSITADMEEYQIETMFDLWKQRHFDNGVDVLVVDVTVTVDAPEAAAAALAVEDDSDESEAA